MNSKKYVIAAAVVILVLLAGVVIFYFWWDSPRELPVDMAGGKIHAVQLRAGGEDELNYTEGWDEATLLYCVSRCVVNRPEPHLPKGYFVGEREFTILFEPGDGQLHLLTLGEVNRVVSGGLMYEVVNHGELKESLRALFAEQLRQRVG